MFKKLKIKLRSKRGESLTEVLIAVLVSGIALMLLASTIAATKTIVTRSKAATQDYVGGNNQLVEKKTETVSGAGNIEFDVMDSVGNYHLTKLTDDSPTDISVQYYVNSALKTVLVAAYEKGGGT